MTITIRCDSCGFQAAAVASLAGKAVRCRQCQAIIQVPRPPEARREAPAPAGPPLRFRPASAPTPARPTPPAIPPAPAPTPARARPAPAADPGPAWEQPPGERGFHVGWIVGAIGGFLLLAMVTLAVLMANRAAGGKGGAATPAREYGPIAVKASLPPFPAPGPGTPFAAGVTVHEVHFAGGSRPGHDGSLRLYLPAGTHADRSLPCVLIAGAGTNLLHGAGIGSRKEHLPYVRAGFAVLAYEQDGRLSGGPPAGDGDLKRAYEAFRSAQAGLVNGYVAIEYLLARVPQVDPARLFAAGHSSAGTMAVLLAEHEPRLAGCVAFAPCLDLEARFGAVALTAAATTFPGVREFVPRFSPRNHEATLQCPLFLFHAEDDANVPVAQSRAAADRLKGLGKTATLATVPTGDHYDAMIKEGIPRAIDWLRSEATSRGGTPPVATTPAPGDADPD